jgi:hypothetical protein
MRRFECRDATPRRAARSALRRGLAIALCAAAASCGKEGPTEIDLISDLPPTPFDLRAVVGETQAEIRWEIPDTAGVGSYRVYRAIGGEMSLITTVNMLRYLDANLVSGRSYFYQVSAVTRAGVEGRRSEVLEAKPSVYGVEISGGAEFTNTRRVTIDLFAPPGTLWMAISNDSSFSGVAYRAFQSLDDWTLLEGDGEKRVFARFRDSLGSESETRSDAIALDTRAEIAAFTATEGIGRPAISSAKTYVPGDTLFFSVNAGEMEGDAAATVGTGIVDLLLRDDGQGGDRVAGNGVYELLYVVPGGLDFQRLAVTGSFFDRAGNAAAPVTLLSTLTIGAEPPPPVTLSSAAADTGAVRLAWTTSAASDFAAYRIYRSTTEAVSESTAVLATISDRAETQFVDATVLEATTYYYRVFVVSSAGASAGSNKLSATTPNLAPPAVPLAAPSLSPGGVSPTPPQNIVLSWAASAISDFGRYEVFVSQSSGGAGCAGAPVATLRAASLASYTHVALTAGTYFFSVRTVDALGLSACSNVVSAVVQAP